MQHELFSDLPTLIQDGHSKTCSKCSRELPLSSFSRASGGNYLRTECKRCSRELSSVRTKLNKSIPKPSADYQCPICNKKAEDVVGHGGKSGSAWVLDHNHETNSYRGWLCHKCNRGLGSFNDNTETLQRAIKYLYGT